MIGICDNCNTEVHWTPDMDKCPNCGSDEKHIDVYNEDD